MEAESVVAHGRVLHQIFRQTNPRTKLRVTLYKEEARGAAERAGSVRARLHEGVTVAAHSVGVAQRGTRPTLTRRRGAHRGAGEWILIVYEHTGHEVAGGAHQLNISGVR